MDKVALRRVMTKKRAALGAPSIRTRSARVLRRVCALGEYPLAPVVSFYAAGGGEVDPRPLAREALRRGVTVCYPRVEGRGRLSFRRVRRLSDLAAGALRIFAPRADSPRVPARRIALFLVPGLAFDASGGRLGRGGGYYDAALRGMPGLKVGLGYDFQLVGRVPRTRRDVRLDLVVTESAVHRT